MLRLYKVCRANRPVNLEQFLLPLERGGDSVELSIPLDGNRGVSVVPASAVELR